VRLVTAGQGGTSLERLAVLRNLQESTRARHEFEGLDREALRGMDNYEIAALVSFHVVGGTSRLTEAMAAALGDRVRLGHRVTAIEQTAEGCALRCANGRVVTADFALLAVPFSVLRGIDLEPALTGDQAEAVARMTYGNQSQVWLRARTPYWEKDGIEASMWTDGPFTMIRQQIEHDGSRELVSALAFGEKSRRIDAMSETERGQYAIAELERIRPAMRGELEFIGAHSWEAAPYSRGCSFQLVPGRVHAWTAAMGQPHGRLHFAGEHLRLLEVGMEAAMESGERSALAIAERLQG
jgi:monoamine oxidase